MLLTVVCCFAGAREATASPQIEIDGFGGLHTFSNENELGQVDVADADSPKNSPAFGIRVALALTGLLTTEAELAVMPTSARDSDADVVVFGWRGHAMLHFLGPKSRLRPFVLAGGGALTSSSNEDDVFLDDTDALFHGGLGVKIGLGKTWGLRADGRVLFPPSSDDDFATGEFEFLLGIYKTFLGGDEAPGDRDGDGITDDADRCPAEPEDVDRFEDPDGCPDPDNDRDGIPDGTDQCPLEAESKNGIDDTDGCPEEDGDNDGIIGTSDQCPNEPEDFDKKDDTDGCPEPDNDNDGILDRADACPDEPETANNFEDEDGCPDTVPVAVQQFTGTIEGIRFKRKSAEIVKSSHKVLDAAVKVLTDYPAVRMEIQGHTDSDGTDEFNLDLSQRRADAVKAYMVSKGIDEARLESKGYGEANPIEDNAKAAGKAKNRRVEFVLIQQGAAPSAPATP
jgi:OOP family OmpA-OmpF porin